MFNPLQSRYMTATKTLRDAQRPKAKVQGPGRAIIEHLGYTTVTSVTTA